MTFSTSRFLFPLLYNIYILSIANIFNKYTHITFYLYISYIFINALVKNYVEKTKCHTELYNWMAINYLHINETTTKLIIILHKSIDSPNLLR